MKKKRLVLQPNEIAFRRMYTGLLEREKITTIFRPGKRLPGDFRGYYPGQKVTVRIISEVGADWALLPPKFVKQFSKKAVIKKVEVKKLGEVRQSDFRGASPDIHDIKSLTYHLGVIYNLSDKELHKD